MKRIFSLIFISLLALQSCGLGEQEKTLIKKQKELTAKEQELLAWEQRLKMKEQELDNARQLLDSAKMQIDSASVYDPAIVGKWTVRMNCIATNCEGSAIGDTKTEQWEIKYEQNRVVVNAYSGKVLSRVYKGGYKDNILKVVAEKSDADVTISATLNFANEKRIEGSREIIQSACKIVYGLNAERSK